MADFVKGGGALTPFGNNNYLRSTSGVLTESYTVSKAVITAQTIDTVAGQKILPKGVLMAKITSTAEAGKIGPFQGGTLQNEVQTVTITGTPTGGTFKLAYRGNETANIAYNAAAAAVQTALLALPNLAAGDVTVTGGPGPGTPWTLTFGGALAGQDVERLSLAENGLTGGTAPTVVVAVTTAGGVSAGAATDGREDPANIVGLNNTFLPWQLMERDVEVAVAYACSAMQGWCYEYNASGALVVLSNRSAGLTQNRKDLDITFK
jgi:hypothetical protein